jgi:hypothetical protein
LARAPRPPAGTWVCKAESSCHTSDDYSGINDPFDTCTFRSDPKPRRAAAVREALSDCRNDRDVHAFGRYCELTECKFY